jgi:ElaB/YqjD/DUF883 family membrane-anchored ribosome-binding protein
MPDNPNINQPNTGTHGTTGGAGGSGGTGSMGTSGNIGSTGTEGHGLHGTPGTVIGGTGTGTAPALAQQYGQKISEVATQAKDFVADKVSVVGDKIKDLQNADIGELAENAKEYARKKPGQALLISAAVGLVLGLLVRGGRR